MYMLMKVREGRGVVINNHLKRDEKKGIISQ
jgi:hypothetical protein